MSKTIVTRSRSKLPSKRPDPSQNSSTSSSDEVSGRQEAMRKYMKVAMAKRKKKSPKKLDYDDYIMISVGKMNFDYEQQKGAIDKSFVPVKIPFRRESDYSEVLQKCIDHVWREAPEGECFLADGSGSKITGDDFPLSVKGKDPLKVPWTLWNYIKLSSGKYPSRIRLYCVNLHSPPNIENDPQFEVTSPKGTRPSPAKKRNKVVNVKEGEESSQEKGSNFTPQTPGSHMFDADVVSSAPPKGFFSVSFLERIYSRYSSNVSFRYLDQSRILTTSIDDHDCMQEVADSLLKKPLYRLFPDNPLQHGFFLDAVIPDDGEQLDFIETADCESGAVIYKMPSKDSILEVWTGCYCSVEDHIAVMACIALNGYHGIATYHWESEGRILREETPLLYSGIGKYKCIVKAGDTVLYEVFVVSEEKGTLGVEHVVTEDKTTDKQESILVQGVTPLCNVSELNEIKSQVEHSKVSELHKMGEIGRGTFGHVYKAIWRGMVVAAKEIRVAGNKKFLENELSVYKSLNHPNILSLMGTITKPSSIILITNFVNGPTLHSMIFEEEKQLSFRDKAFISLQLCQALVFMHTATPPVAHLDVKPENVMVEKATLKVYLGDFGLGKVMTGTKVFGVSTMQSGTPGFQSPEQLKGEKLGIECDVYSLGAVLTELFGMKPIWDSSLSGYTIMYNVTSLGQMPKHDHLPPNIQKVVKVCLCPIDVRASATMVLGMLCNIAA